MDAACMAFEIAPFVINDSLRCSAGGGSGVAGFNRASGLDTCLPHDRHHSFGFQQNFDTMPVGMNVQPAIEIDAEGREIRAGTLQHTRILFYSSLNTVHHG